MKATAAKKLQGLIRARFPVRFALGKGSLRSATFKKLALRRPFYVPVIVFRIHQLAALFQKIHTSPNDGQF